MDAFSSRTLFNRVLLSDVHVAMENFMSASSAAADEALRLKCDCDGSSYIYICLSEYELELTQEHALHGYQIPPSSPINAKTV
jgi:hypothetical protein